MGQKQKQQQKKTVRRMKQSEKIVCTDKDRNKLFVPQNFITQSKKYLFVPYLKFHITVHQRMVSVTVSAVRAVYKLILDVLVIG